MLSAVDVLVKANPFGDLKVSPYKWMKLIIVSLTAFLASQLSWTRRMFVSLLTIPRRQESWSILVSFSLDNSLCALALYVTIRVGTICKSSLLALRTSEYLFPLFFSLGKELQLLQLRPLLEILHRTVTSSNCGRDEERR